MFDGGDTLLTTRSISALGVGGSFNDSFSLTAPLPEALRVRVADHGAIAEGDDGNNASTGVLINVAASLTVVGGGGTTR